MPNLVGMVPMMVESKLQKLTGLCASSLQSELLWFARNFDMLSKSLRDEFEAAVSDGDELCSNSESEAQCAVSK